MIDHEQAFVASFVIPEKRAHYAEFLRKPKRRGEITDRLNHFFDFVPALATQIPRESAAKLATLLRARGAPDTAHLIADGKAIDGKDLPLEHAIDSALDDLFGVVISCVPGRLALYLQEFPPGDVFLLVNPPRRITVSR